MKKTLAILSALALITTISCGSKPSEKQSETPSASYTAEKLSDVLAYKKNSLAIPENCFQIWTFMPYNGGEDYLLLGSGMTSPQFWHTKDFNSYETIDYPDFEIGARYDLSCADDGTIVTLVIMADQEANSEGTYPEDTEFKFVINAYKDGALVSSADVVDFDGEASMRTTITGIYSDGEIVIARISGGFEMFKITGEYIGELTSEEWDIDAVGRDKSGRLICTAASKEKDSDKMKICYINPDGTLTDCNSVVYDFPETPQRIQVGAGDYDIFLWSFSTVFGIKPDGEIEPLLNITAAGLTADSITGVTLAESGNVAVMSKDYSTWTMAFKEYVPRTKEEMEGIPVLTFGTVDQGDYIMKEFVTKWNDEGHDFMLEYKGYDVEYDEDGSVVMNELQEDMLTGNLPDIMYLESYYNMNLEKNGALCDLYEFIDNDDTISRDTFVPNALHCFENDGKLYYLPDRFYLNVGKAAKTKFVGDGTNWSFDKYIDVITDPALDLEIQYDSKQWRLGYGAGYEDWIDAETATCHYTDESFIKYLEWCNIPDDIEPEYPDYDEWTEEDHRAEYMKQQRRFIDDKAIFEHLSWGRYSSYVQDTRGQFNGEEITYLEAPTLEGTDKLAITSTSQHKDLAWEYIKSRLTDESYTMPQNSFQAPFPITKSGLEIYLEQDRSDYIDYTQYEEITDPEWLNYRGVIYQLAFTIYGDTVMQLGEITDEDAQFVNDMISRAEPYEDKYLQLGNDYYDIMHDEIYRFFYGEITAQQCAEYIQDRVSIYLSEQFG